MSGTENSLAVYLARELMAMALGDEFDGDSVNAYQQAEFIVSIEL